MCKLKAEIDSPDATAREAALLAIKQLCLSVGRPCEPYVVPLLACILERLADKIAPVRDAALEAGLGIMSILCPHAAELVLPVVFDSMSDSKKWQVKEGALKLLSALAESAPLQVSARLTDIVPLISERMVDPREQVGVVAVLCCPVAGLCCACSLSCCHVEQLYLLVDWNTTNKKPVARCSVLVLMSGSAKTTTNATIPQSVRVLHALLVKSVLLFE